MPQNGVTAWQAAIAAWTAGARLFHPPRDTVRASVTVAGGRFSLFGGLAGPLRGGWGETAPAEAEAST